MNRLIAGSLVVAVSSVAIVGGTLATGSTSQAAKASQTSTISVGEGMPKTFTLSLTRTRVPAGKVTFRVSNHGPITHELLVIRTKLDSAALPGPAQRVSEAGIVLDSGDVRAKNAKTLSAKLSPGHYVVICNLPGHYAGGMRADLTVT